MSALTTTFKELRGWGACRLSYRKLAKALGGIRTYGRTTPIKLSRVLDICGIEDCFWVIDRTVLNADQRRELRLCGCDCAERVLPLFEAECPGDPRPRRAIEAGRRYARNEIGHEELASIGDDAWDAWAGTSDRAAAWAAWTAWAAAGSVRYALATTYDGAVEAAGAAADSADERAIQTQTLHDVLVKLETEEQS